MRPVNSTAPGSNMKMGLRQSLLQQTPQVKSTPPMIETNFKNRFSVFKGYQGTSTTNSVFARASDFSDNSISLRKMNNISTTQSSLFVNQSMHTLMSKKPQIRPSVKKGSNSIINQSKAGDNDSIGNESQVDHLEIIKTREKCRILPLHDSSEYFGL